MIALILQCYTQTLLTTVTVKDNEKRFPQRTPVEIIVKTVTSDFFSTEIKNKALSLKQQIDQLSMKITIYQ